MTRLKFHIVYTFLGAFIASTATALCGAAGLFTIESGPLIGLFGAVIAQCVTVIIAILKSQHFFDDPDEIKKLQAKHQEDIASLQNDQASSEIRWKKSLLQLQLSKDEEIAGLSAQVARHEAEMRELEKIFAEFENEKP